MGHEVLAHETEQEDQAVQQRGYFALRLLSAFVCLVMDMSMDASNVRATRTWYVHGTFLMIWRA